MEAAMEDLLQCFGYRGIHLKGTGIGALMVLAIVFICDLWLTLEILK